MAPVYNSVRVLSPVGGIPNHMTRMRCLGSWLAAVCAVVVTTAGVLTLAACGGGGTAEDLPADDGANASLERTAALDPIAEADAEWPGHVAQLLGLTRTGEGILELRFAIANRGPDGTVTDLGAALGTGPGDEGTVADVYLVDPVKQKKYFVLRDAEGRALCSRDVEPLASGGRAEFWARFPAPADDTSSVDVYVPRAPAFVGVPVPSPTVDAAGTHDR